MKMKFFTGTIASQPAVVTLNGVQAGVMVIVLIEIGGKYKKFCYTSDRPDNMFSDILVSSVGDKVRVGVCSTSYCGAEIINNFYNLTRKFGNI